MSRQCIECNYFTNLKSNIDRHMTSAKHLRICHEISNKEAIIKYECICGLNLKSRRSLCYHKKRCSSITVKEEVKYVERMDHIEIDEIKSKMKPISMLAFIKSIVFEASDFDMYGLDCDENVFINSLAIFQRSLNLLEIAKRPFINFNEGKDQYFIHFYVNNEWVIESQVSILKILIKCDVKLITKKSFIYYLNLFHQRRMAYYRKNFVEKNCVRWRLSSASSSSVQDELICKLMEFVVYIHQPSNENFIDQDAIPAIDSRCEGKPQDSL